MRQLRGENELEGRGCDSDMASSKRECENGMRGNQVRRTVADCFFRLKCIMAVKMNKTIVIEQSMVLLCNFSGFGRGVIEKNGIRVTRKTGLNVIWITFTFLLTK